MASHSPSDTAVIRQRLAEQLYSPVRWTDTIQKFAAGGTTRIVEMGPGKVLGGLVKRIDRSIEIMSVNDGASLERAIATVSGA